MHLFLGGQTFSHSLEGNVWCRKCLSEAIQPIEEPILLYSYVIMSYTHHFLPLFLLCAHWPLLLQSPGSFLLILQHECLDVFLQR